MAATRLGLYELLAPQFLVGFTFPEHVDRYLSVLGVDELRTGHDGAGVVYAGRCSFVGQAGASPVREHKDPSGALLQWEDVAIDFRLTIPRDGAAFVDTAVSAPTIGSPELKSLFDRLGPVEGPLPVPTDYPGVRFRLELLLSTLTFHLGKKWLPATLDAEHRVVPDPARTSDDVKFVLPKIKLVYEQGDDLTRPPVFELASWGSGGFDAPHDLLAGEAVRMEPELAIHESGRVGFGVGQVVLDLSENSTPPEILQFFGTDEGFKGVYVRSARVFWSDRDKGFAVNAAVQDVLVSFAGEVSLEASLDVIGPESKLEATVRFLEGAREVPYTKGTTSGTIVPGKASILNTAEVQLLISGGVPPYTIEVRLGSEVLQHPATRRFPLSPGAPATLRPPGQAELHVKVEDSGTTGSGGTRKTYLEDIDLTIRAAPAPGGVLDGAPADRPRDTAPRPDAIFDVTSRSPDPLPAGYGVTCTPAASGLTERIVVTGAPGATVTAGGASRTLDASGSFGLDVPPGGDIQIAVSWPASPASRETFTLLFEKGRPDPEASEEGFASIRATYVADTESPPDVPFSTSRAPSGAATSRGSKALEDWIENRVLPGGDAHIEIEGRASWEGVAAEAPRDQILSARRLAVAREIVTIARPGVTFDQAVATGHADAKPNRLSNPGDRVALIEAATSVAAPAVTVQARIRRAATPTTVPTPAPAPAPAPAPPPNRPPSVFRRAGLRVRLERNVLVLGEISGRLDFETDIESELRQASGDSAGNLQLTPTTAASANPNPQDGVTDFLLAVTYDTATHQLSERLAIGAAPDDRDGLFRMTNPRAAGGSSALNRFKDIFGALLVMAPVINSTASAVDPRNAGDWAPVAVSLAVPVAVGGAGVFKTETVTLYGGEARLRQSVPPGEAMVFSDFGVIFDYGVEFGIEISQLDIKTTRPLKVRYRAAGFNIHIPGGPSYQPIFDTSRGYELDLSDPGLFKLPSPLGDLLKILSARIARTNPLTLEVDIGLKVDLGVVTVDRFKVRWPLDPLGPPTILPTGVKVDISGVLVGSGYVNIVQPGPVSGGAISGGGFEGTADISLVSLKLRISASLGVQTLTKDDRKAVAVFAGLIVEFPAPIPLAQSGLGIFGFSGLFAMHYKRDELPPDGTAVSPALRWLVRAQGEPAKLIVNGDTIWKPELDRWSFGVGAIIGTTDGFVVNLRGMLVLELPGPRILIFIKLQVIADLPQLGEGGLTVGLLGTIDLDFARMQLTVGVIADIGVGEIVQLTLPVELFVKLNNPRIWHMYLGTHRAPASAMVLNLVRASGYFMIEGDRIEDWPGTDPPTTLPGLALAAGLEASIVLGDEGIGLYLRVAAGAHFGITFNPVLFVAGRIYLEGELRLFIVSIEASGELEAQAKVNSPTDVQTFIRGKICGKVSFFFFSVKGCVEHSVGTPVLDPPAPPLLNNVFLQSHTPVLTSGQGGDRPIDASLGDAAPAGSTTVPEVPIDSVPVLQLSASPLVAGAVTFTQTLVASPQQTADGYIKLGGGRQALYELKELALSPALPTGGGLPPATWRTERPPDPQSTDTTIDLALMSRIPTVASRALERSTELDASIERRWRDLCKPVAPATCVLYTFCGQRLGPSGDGWRLVGTPQPDPPGTVRTTPVPRVLDVEENGSGATGQLIDLLVAEGGLGAAFPAEVIGPNENGGRNGRPPTGDLTCVRFAEPTPQPGANPLVRGGLTFGVHDHAGALAAGTEVVQIKDVTGLHVGFRCEISFASPADAVELTLAHFSRPAKLTAFAVDGTTVDSQAMTASAGELETIRLSGSGGSLIARALIDARQDETLLASVCFATKQGERSPLEHNGRRARGTPLADPRRERLARGFLARSEARERLAAEEAAERSAALALRSDEGLAPVAGVGRRTFAARARATGKGAQLCHRALKLPHTSPSARPDAIELPDKLQEQAKARTQEQWVILRTGRAVEITIFLALARKDLELVVRQLDPDGNVLDESRLSDLSPTPVSGVTTGLPAEWVDPSGPWRSDVEPVATFLADPAFAALERVLVEVEPKEETDRIQLLVERGKQPVEAPGAIVGVVEVCPRAERGREATDELIKQGQIETLQDYLNGGAVVPLLKPTETYTLKVRYDVRMRLEGGSPGSPTSRTEQFLFKTDDQPPARLDPWVLGTTPDNEERFHFTGDAVKLVFNDLAVLQLYGAYSKKLRFVLRTADGVPIPGHEINSLDPIEAGLSTPYRDFLEGMVAAGELPCAGSTTAELHGSWTSPVPLRPLMDYTLDVEMDPAPAPPPDTEPRVPLFRRAFTTSRFSGLQALVEDLQRRRIRHRALRTQLTGLPTGAPVAVAPDETMQSALLAAGDPARGAPEESGIVVLWARRPGATNYSLHAILLDAAEPLWRTRQEPKLEKVPGQLDPAYQRAVPAEVVAMHLVEQGSAAIDRWVRSPSGTRTIALVKDTFSVPAAGAMVTIRAERPASSLYGLSAEAVTVLGLQLSDGGAAPWETDDA